MPVEQFLTYLRFSQRGKLSQLGMEINSIDAHSQEDRYDLVDEQALGSALAEITQHRILTISNSMDLPS